MSNEIVRMNGRSNVVPRQSARAIEYHRRHGLETAARVHAGAYVARVGMIETAQLSALEGMLIQQVPLAEARMKAIVDQFAFFASFVVGDLG
jgi:hypothetical protein